MSPSVVVGIGGGSGSGKTALARALLRGLGPDRGVRIPVDAYYRDLSHLPPAERIRRNFDHPDALETPLLVHHLDRLRAGQPIRMPRYDFASHTRRAGGTRVDPAQVVVLDGVLVLALDTLRTRLDVRVFVQAPADTRLRRRIARDTADRGRDRCSVERQWRESVLPMHERLVEPSRRHAHLVVPGEGPVADAARLVDRHIRRVRSGGDAAPSPDRPVTGS